MNNNCIHCIIELLINKRININIIKKGERKE